MDRIVGQPSWQLIQGESPDHPPVRVWIILFGAALHLVHDADKAAQTDDAVLAFTGGSTMPDARGMVGVSVRKLESGVRV